MMKKMPEKIRLFLSGNVNSEAGALFSLILNILTLLVPAYALQIIYFGGIDNSLFSMLFFAAFAVCSLIKKYAFYGALRIVIWCWSAVVVATKADWPLWLVVLFYIFMVIGMLRVAIVWWLDDDKLTEKGNS